MSNNTESIEMFGKKIEYDPNETYGVFNSQGQYGSLPVEKTLKKWASVGDKKELLDFLNGQLEGLNGCLNEEKVLDILVDEGIIATDGPSKPNEIVERQKREVQNTIDLMKNMVEVLS